MAMAAGLARRERVAELMDDPALDPGRHEAALRGLGRLNRASRSAGLLWPEVRRWARETRGRPLRVLDLASGGGDVAIELWRRARREGLEVRVDGCDLSTVALDFARRQAARHAAEVHFFPLDLLREPLPNGYDVLCASLFLHHLDDGQALGLLRAMAAAAGRGVLVNDLERSRLGLLLAGAATRALTRSEVVHVDGPRSVRAAFSARELGELAARAGLEGAAVRRCWPCRMVLTWERQG